jgi:hypothetical protein
MAAKYPKSESDAQDARKSEPAYVSWEGTKQDHKVGIAAYGEAVPPPRIRRGVETSPI